MRSSLANLPRMSMDTLNQRDDGDRALRIWLLSAVTSHGGATSYRLAGRFQANGQTWEVLRRYSEFLELRGKLIKFLADADDDGTACPGCINYLFAIRRFEFPKKHIFSSRNPAVVNYRVKALRSFMNLLASWAFSTAPKCPLCGGHAFDLVRNFVVDGAEPVTGSDMDYIRGSISVDAFTSSAERPSAFARPSLERRHSWIPASGSTTLRAQEERQQQQREPGSRPSSSSAQQPFRPSSSARRAKDPGPREPDPYDTFNDYLPARPSQRAKASNTEAAAPTGKFSAQRPGDAQEQPKYQQLPEHKPESFLLYSDASFGSASADGPQAPAPAVSSHSNSGKLRKHKSEPRNVAQPRHDEADDSFASFSSAANATHVPKAGDDDSFAMFSQHSNMLSSPNALPPSAQQTSNVFDSFMSDTVASFGGADTTPPDDGARRLRVGGSPSDEDEDEDDDVVDDSEIDITGLALASPPRKTRPTSRSGEGLWEPWELARVG
ncbi:hypothetical protein PybrP1_009575 [[Pythium] brassicae (nom. inval.)]|nr:hypothetical protein PybrP1_009575 [[Pythium] brassicae (nom. inval.)]